MPDEQRFKLTWDVQKRPTSEPTPPGMSSGDKMIALELHEQPDGGANVTVYGFSAATSIEGAAPDQPGKLTPTEQFGVWLMSAIHFSNLEGLDEGRRTFAGAVLASFFEGPGRVTATDEPLVKLT